MENIKFHKASGLGLKEPRGNIGTHTAPRLGIPTDASKDDFENTHLSNVPINIKKLINDLRSNYFEHSKFDAKNYIDHDAIERARDEAIKARKQDALKEQMQQFEKVRDKIPQIKPHLKQLKPAFKPLSEQEVENIQYRLLESSISLNTCVDFIDNKVNKNEYNVHIDIFSDSIIYEYYIYYKTSEQTKNRNKAILINSNDPGILFFFIEKVYGKTEADKLKKSIYEMFVEELENAKNIQRLIYLHENLPHYIKYAYDIDKETGKKRYKLSDELLWKNFMFFVNFDKWDDASYYVLYIMTLITPKYCIEKFREDQSLVIQIYDGLDDRNTIDRLFGEYQYSETFRMDKTTLVPSNKDAFVTLLNSYIQWHEGDDSVTAFESTGAHFRQGVIKKEGYNGTDSDIKYWLVSDTEDDKIHIKNRKKGKIGRGVGLNVSGNSHTVYDYVNVYFEGSYNPLDVVKFTLYNDKGEPITMNVPAILVYHADYVEDWERIYEGIRFGTNVLMIVVGVAALSTGLGSIMLIATITELGLASSDIVIQGSKDHPFFKTAKGKEFLKTWDEIYTVGTIFTGAPVFIKGVGKIITKGGELLQVTGKIVTDPQIYKQIKEITTKAIRTLEIPNFNKTGLEILKKGFKSIPDLRNATKLQELGVIFAKNIYDDIVVLYKNIPIAIGKAKEVVEQLYKVLKLRGDELIISLQELAGICSLELKNKKFLDVVKYVTENRVFKEILTLHEEAIIYYYTTSAYENLNLALRGIINSKREYIIFKKLLNRALDKLPNSIYNSVEHTLYRSVELSEELIHNLFIGKTEYIEKAFTSTAYDYQKFLDNWFQWQPNHNVIFKIQGKNGKLVEAISDIDNEAEILFKSNTKFEILNVSEINNPLDNTKRIYEIILKEK